MSDHPNVPARQLQALQTLGRYMTRSERQCMFKRVHRSEDSAVTEAERLRSLGESRARAYRCDECGEWHVGKRRQS